MGINKGEKNRSADRTQSSFDALNFIEADVKRGADNRIWLTLVSVLFIALVPPLIGLGLRSSGFHLFSPTLAVGLSNLFGSLLLTVLIAASFATRFSSYRWVRSAFVFLALGLLLASSRVFTTSSITNESMTNPEFLNQCLSCFIAGSLTCVLVGAGLLTMAFGFGSVPTQRFRIILAATAGVAGALMLGYHCDRPEFTHVFLSHWLPGFIFGSLWYLLAEWIGSHLIAGRMGIHRRKRPRV